MIINEHIKVLFNNKNKDYYNKKGYLLEDGFFNVKSIDLPTYSKVVLEVSCDICFLEKKVIWKNYYKITDGLNSKYYCKKCKYLKIEETNSKKTEEEKRIGIDKMIETNSKKSDKEKEDIIKKYKKTIFEKYGVENISQSPIIKKKKEETFLKNWNVKSSLELDYVKKKRDKNYILSKEKSYLNTIIKYSNLIGDNFEIISYIDSEFTIYDNRNNTEFIIDFKTLYDRLKYHKTEISPIINPIGSKNTSGLEQQFISWFKENNIIVLENSRKIISPKELDIYIPSHNLAIEFNGLRWHSEKFINNDYHLNKSLECQKQGIQLLHIWEDEWIFKRDIIKSIILNKLGKISERIYARQCVIKPVTDSKLVRWFLDENHIQGFSSSSIKLGLYYQNELISLMTFGYRHTNSKKEFELIRFCNKINLNVIGAASKLFSYFKKNYPFENLISYSDMRLFDGKMYETLGFEKKHLSKPDYFWFKGLDRRHRSNFMKNKLIKQGFNSNKTEVEIMYERGYDRIWGCGQYRWEYTKPSLPNHH